MRLSAIVYLSSVAGFAVAAPTSQDSPLARREEVQLKDGTFLHVTHAEKTKRSPQDIQLSDGSFLHLSESVDAEKRNVGPLDKRTTDGISSCGPKSGWTPVADHWYDGIKWWGYESAVKEFCKRASYDFNGNPIVLSAKTRASLTVRYEHDYDNSGYRIALKNGIPGHIEFEVNNKQKDGEHRIEEQPCIRYLMAMAYEGQSCYGENNDDTKGGTWQVGDEKISYHALPIVTLYSPLS